MKTEKSKQGERIFVRLFLKSAASEVIEEAVAHFRDHPEQIDEIIAPVKVHQRLRSNLGLEHVANC